MRLRRPSLAQVNTSLTVLIVVICGYVIVAPLVPALQFQIAEWRGKHKVPAYPIHSLPSKTLSVSKDKPKDNRLAVTSAGINEPLIEGESSASLAKGIWVASQTSTPDKGSNTVLAGHRFLYKNALFYNLDKVNVGDIVAIFWENKEYNYRVTSVEVVAPDATGIQAATKDPILTMYTCTPLWTAKDRLVVRAALIYKEL